jgi:hypothetical protein
MDLKKVKDFRDILSHTFALALKENIYSNLEIGIIGGTYKSPFSDIDKINHTLFEGKMAVLFDKNNNIYNIDGKHSVNEEFLNSIEFNNPVNNVVLLRIKNKEDLETHFGLIDQEDIKTAKSYIKKEEISKKLSIKNT